MLCIIYLFVIIAMFLQRIDSQHAKANKQRTLFYIAGLLMIRFNKNTGTCEMVHELKREQIVIMMADNVMPYSTENVVR